MRYISDYRHTIRACFLGYITQSVVCNFAPLLFVTFNTSYNIPLEKIALLVAVTFIVQLFVDLLCAKLIDRIGYRICIVSAHFLAATGFIGMGILPELLADPFTGLLIPVIVYSIGSGLMEVLLSPIIEACPTENKSGTMSLLHSFYSWGSVFVILVSTAYFTISGIENWNLLAMLWAVIPVCNAVYFMFVPINQPSGESEKASITSLCKNGTFWIFMLLMASAGASELSMAQWVSAFAETALNVPKAAGDLAGPCFFAIMMGTSRALYAKISAKVNLLRYMILCGSVCVASYLLAALSPWAVLSLAGCGLCGFSVGVMWPGVLSYSSRSMPKGGTAMFALLALAGDLGCSFGPACVGFISDASGGNLKAGILTAVIFPLILIIGLFICRNNEYNQHKRQQKLRDDKV